MTTNHPPERSQEARIMTTNTEREELAKLIANHEHPNLEPAWEAREDRSPVKFFSRKLANAILAAGYRKPRTITTVEELDALPNGTTLNVMAASPFPVYRWDDCWNFPVGYGSWCDSRKLYMAWGGKGFTVLHTPEPTP